MKTEKNKVQAHSASSKSASVSDMTVGSPLRQICKFALPLILGYILQQMYLVIDAAIVGRWIGVGALAAVGASSSIMFLVMGFCNGACAGFAIPVAQAFGAKDYHKMRIYVANAVRVSAVIATVVTLLSLMFCHRILQLVNTQPTYSTMPTYSLCRSLPPYHSRSASISSLVRSVPSAIRASLSIFSSHLPLSTFCST